MEISLFPNGEYLLKSQILPEKLDFKNNRKLFLPCALWLYMPSLRVCQSQDDKEIREEGRRGDHFRISLSWISRVSATFSKTVVCAQTLR